MPITVGLIAEFAGIESGFFVMGGLLLMVVIFAALYTRRHPEILRSAN
jgi:hypothetical protein